MDELHDDAVVNGAETDIRPARALWRRPSFRATSAREAEIGVDIIVSDGAFTMS